MSRAKPDFFEIFSLGTWTFGKAKGSIRTKSIASSERKNKPVMAFHRLCGGFSAGYGLNEL